MKITIAIGLLMLAIIFAGCVEPMPFSKDQVTIIVDGGVPSRATESNFSPVLTVINQSNRQIEIRYVSCEICKPDQQYFNPSFVTGIEISPNSSKQIKLNGTLSEYFLKSGEYVMPSGTSSFIIQYRVEGENPEYLFTTEYKR